MRSCLGGLIVLTGVGCVRVVDLTVEEGPIRLVVEARVEHLQGTTGSPQRVVLTTTDAVFNNRVPPPATGAVVSVRDAEGSVFAFPESASEPGAYEITHLPTAVGARFTLTIDYAGDRFEATDSVRAAPSVDSLYFEFQESNIFQETEGFRATIDYVDPAGVENFYLWEQLHDGVRQIIPDVGNAFNVIGTDEVFDGQTIIGFQPNDEIAVEPGVAVTVRQISLSSLAYDYLFAMFQQSANGEGSPFSVPPADVRGNVANLTTPTNYPLGFFLVAEVAERSRQLPRDTVP